MAKRRGLTNELAMVPMLVKDTCSGVVTTLCSHWEPPGGVLELGETIEDGLRREGREETGLEVEPSALTGVYKNMTRGIIALVFRARSPAASLQPTTRPFPSVGRPKPTYAT